MGIRIRKAMGYALTDVKTEELTLVDTRFNKKFKEELQGYGFYDNYDIKNYIQFLKKQEIEKPSWLRDDISLKIELSMASRIKKWTANNCILYNPEYGLDNVFCIIPPLRCEDYTRYDDALDYQIEVETKPSAEPYTIDIKYGIYPYNSLFMYKKNGKQVIGDQATALRAIFTTIGKIDQKVVEALSKQFLEMPYEDIHKNIALFVPDEIVLFCEYLKIFKSRKTIWDLKPIIYTYWA